MFELFHQRQAPRAIEFGTPRPPLRVQLAGFRTRRPAEFVILASLVGEAGPLVRPDNAPSRNLFPDAGGGPEQSPSLRCCRREFPAEQKERHPMNWDRVEGNWKTFKGQVQQKWGKLTDDDLDVIEGKRTELAGRLQQRYGYAKDEADKNIDSWLNSVN
jgi:uncharacterized protein YjbJ (UPF0337 family)